MAIQNNLINIIIRYSNFIPCYLNKLFSMHNIKDRQLARSTLCNLYCKLKVVYIRCCLEFMRWSVKSFPFMVKKCEWFQYPNSMLLLMVWWTGQRVKIDYSFWCFAVDNFSCFLVSFEKKSFSRDCGRALNRQ